MLDVNEAVDEVLLWDTVLLLLAEVLLLECVVDEELVPLVDDTVDVLVEEVLQLTEVDVGHVEVEVTAKVEFVERVAVERVVCDVVVLPVLLDDASKEVEGDEGGVEVEVIEDNDDAEEVVEVNADAEEVVEVNADAEEVVEVNDDAEVEVVEVNDDAEVEKVKVKVGVSNSIAKMPAIEV